MERTQRPARVYNLFSSATDTHQILRGPYRCATDILDGINVHPSGLYVLAYDLRRDSAARKGEGGSEIDAGANGPSLHHWVGP